MLISLCYGEFTRDDHSDSLQPFESLYSSYLRPHSGTKDLSVAMGMLLCGVALLQTLQQMGKMIHEETRMKLSLADFTLSGTGPRFLDFSHIEVQHNFGEKVFR